MPVSSLIAGSRMLTADVLALTTSVDRQVAASTPLALAVATCDSVIDPRPSGGGAVGEALEQQRLGNDELLDLGRIYALVGGVDAGARDVLRAPEHELGSGRSLLERAQQRDRPTAAGLTRREAVGVRQRGACGGV